MSSVLYQLGRWAVGARRLVVIGWLGILVITGAAGGLVFQGFDNSITIPGTESQEALDQLSATFPEVSGTSAQVVVVAPDGGTIEDDDVRGPVEDAADRIGDLDEVAAVATPYDEQAPSPVSDDEAATIVTVQLDGDAFAISDATKDELGEITDDLAAALPDGAQASLGGQLYANELPHLSIIEVIGVVVALIVLLFTLGSLVAAGLPLVNALLGVGVSMLLLLAATVFGPINSTTPMLGLMLGLAVGIDYALFIVSRHQEQLRDGIDVRESVARATATAGSAVIFAGLTVMIALVGLGVAGIPFLSVMGIAAAAAVGVAVLVSLTLLPALLAIAGDRLRPRATKRRTSRRASRRADRGADAAPDGAAHHNRFFAGWVRGVTKVPIATIAIVVVALGALTLPAANLRLALPDAGYLPEDNSARQTYDLVSEYFGPGFNGPLIVTGSIITSTDPVGLMDDLAAEIEDLPGVASVPLSTPNQTADTGIIQVVPEGAPDSEETKALVEEIRGLHDQFLDEYGVDLAVTGATAVGIDVSDKLGDALVPFGLVVVGLSLLLLTMVFRSVWVPVKATLGYLLSVGAAFGAVTLVFEEGLFAEALNVTKLGPVISFMPIILMGVLFGLAMDYEVFLVSRIREDYVHNGGRARQAILTGFQGSAKVVTAAAIIMFGVFVAFVPEGDMTLKPIALGLAVGVAVDAFVVRMVLVPAVLALLGDKAWWMPRWLDRALPTFDVEGEGLAKELRLASWPGARPDGGVDAVVVRDLEVSGPRGPGLGEPPLVGPVSVRVPDGGTLAVHGDAAAPVNAFLLAVAGRIRPDAGVAKVTGLVLPERASSVRSRVAVVDAVAEDGDPAAAVTAAVRQGATVVVVDRTDVVADRPAREALATTLSRAHAAGVTLLVGATGVVATDLLPGPTPVLDVGVGWGAPATLQGGEEPPPVPRHEPRHAPGHEAEDGAGPDGQGEPEAAETDDTTEEVRA
ncbi:RND superfamily putative drug exporter [Isoptericola sp. CG 20/1183]|uniref:RND superfamily putative drug exporter n=1 Tax=Isoptericola halotolerans TaxID=300560 RepID=A0ABX5EKC7_9MICO|nr:MULTISPECIES: MMPL family transporter [Isoptericola]PRZ09312.1 RND superfamily putative drug exporter [Isoptericola sp. CG 20/1183]PRZ10113.1 RND superfamily putative drug exporter [Isoptericola halotolerans]